jgi:hypothetical protein
MESASSRSSASSTQSTGIHLEIGSHLNARSHCAVSTAHPQRQLPLSTTSFPKVKRQLYRRVPIEDLKPPFGLIELTIDTMMMLAQMTTTMKFSFES